jgi:hypothetical protein
VDGDVLSGVLAQHEAILDQFNGGSLETLTEALRSHFCKIAIDEQNLMRALPRVLRGAGGKRFPDEGFPERPVGCPGPMEAKK